jgi:hypothetical protein
MPAAKHQCPKGKFGMAKTRKPGKSSLRAGFSGLGGWLEAHAVTVRTGEIDVPKCRQQWIAASGCRGRFIRRFTSGTGYCRHQPASCRPIHYRQCEAVFQTVQ